MVESEQQNFGLYDDRLDKDSCGVGLITHIEGTQSYDLVSDALTMLENMEHRGSCGFEPNSGDGAGILIQIPDALFRKEAQANSVALPTSGRYGVGMLFLPKEKEQKSYCLDQIEITCVAHDFQVIYQREVSVNSEILGATARNSEPDMMQIFLVPKSPSFHFDLEKKLYFLKNQILKRIYISRKGLIDTFYITSLSAKTIVYKGQLSATQLRPYFSDLTNRSLTSAIAIVHSRFSTNTVPKWKLAQPFRCIAHNGEINTIKGNLNWWKARENFMTKSEIYKDGWMRATPVCDPFLSDSGNFDKVVDFLIRTTRSIAHVMMMLIPEAWQNDTKMDEGKRGFYEYHDAIIEPWDGPAAICFTDGNLVGATLDRNGLRPLRYTVTKDRRLLVASEEGCLPISQALVETKGRLQPGTMLLADLDEKRIISDEEIKAVICNRFPYNKWLKSKRIHLSELSASEIETLEPNQYIEKKQISFGMDREAIDLILTTMAKQGKEPIGSMGADIPLAVFSKMPQHISHYFKQQFAQVTNPPIDSLREKFFMTLSTTLGGTSKVLHVNEAEAAVIRLDSPVLTSTQFNTLRSQESLDFRARVFSSCFHKSQSLYEAIQNLKLKVKSAVEEGINLICISDRCLDEFMLAIPSLMTIGAIHHFLIEAGYRKEVSLVVESGDTWEIHHFAILCAFGADAVYPYLALQTIAQIAEKPTVAKKLQKNYMQAVNKGLLKVMSKLGISTLQSYKGAQTFEAIGISSEVIDTCFKGTTSRIEGMDFQQIQRELAAKHDYVFQHPSAAIPDMGIYQWRRDGEFHLFNPKSIHLLQHSTRTNDYALFKKYTEEIDLAENNASTLRSFIRIKKGNTIPLDEVESVEKILKRFATGAMSFGSISYEAHSTLAKAMNRIGGRSNSGEGGEDERRFQKLNNGDWERSAIKQVASGRFGVTINYLTHADEIQIKMAQGAKPGEGGQLPGHKVDKEIARVRHSTPGVGLISPPPHHDIYSIEDLAQLIFDLKNANRKARISVKLVSKTGVGIIASGVTKAHADHILISGHDGGTGASPMSSISHAGLPWELGLAETHHTLIKNNLRDRVKIQVDGQIRTGRDMAIATLLGAEEWAVATAALVVEGCILMRKCHLNTCPVGIATQDKDLRKKFTGKVDHLVNYFTFLAQHLREIMSGLGFKTVDEMVGRADMLEENLENKHWKTSNVDLSKLLFYAKPKKGYYSFKAKAQDHGLALILDRLLITRTYDAIHNQKDYRGTFEIKNTDRAVGAMLSNEIAKVHGANGLPESRISCSFRGTAGQSFGAFLISGVAFLLEGSANDYFGKGLSGGHLIIKPDTASTFSAAENIIVGNVCLYGATSGQAYINGRAGDRFAVRNSGAHVVVEGIGDNGCEYMTGGVVIVLGSHGRNFAAGMSGGIAYLYRENRGVIEYINTEMVEIEPCNANDRKSIRTLLRHHKTYTSSSMADEILTHWSFHVEQFIKVIPTEYKKALEKHTSTFQFQSKAG